MRRLLPLISLSLLLGGVLAAQTPIDPARRVTDRIRALQQEAEQLATRSRTVLTELRTLEVERDLRSEEAAAALQAVDAARLQVTATAGRLDTLEQQRQAQLPDLRSQLVDIYKRGGTGYARLLFGAGDLRELTRTTRAVAALSAINARRIEEHRATVDRLRRERIALEQQVRDVEMQETTARQAAAAAERAVAARNALMARIDRERDLAAQYVGELQMAYERLQQQVANGRGEPGVLPLAPFRGALDWPVNGRVTRRFTAANGQTGVASVRNGIEVTGTEGMAVRAVHGGTVAYAGAFTGFGTLVIVDHGGNAFTLYGDLASTPATRGDVVEPGTDLGRLPTGGPVAPALYFELRIDGRSVDPLQWLRPR